MLFRLVLTKNGQRARVVEIHNPTAEVGRAHGNTVRIPSAQVSRRHCRLRMKDGLVTVEDLGSVNGTYLNDGLLTAAAVAKPGDLLAVGPVTFIVEYQLTPEARKRLSAVQFGAEEPEEIAEVELAEEEPAEIELLDVEEVEEPAAAPSLATVDANADDVFDVAEAEEDNNRVLGDLEEISWARPESGDMRDMLSLLDEGLESMPPKKRPAPRKPGGKRRPDDD